MDAKIKRDLKIKVNSCKRLAKEIVNYEKEKKELEAKLEKQKAQGMDKYDLKKTQELIEENAAVMTDSRTRAQKALGELDSMLEQLNLDKNSEEYREAKAAIDETNAAIFQQTQTTTSTPTSAPTSTPTSAPTSTPTSAPTSTPFSSTSPSQPQPNSEAKQDKIKVAVYGSSRCKHGDPLWILAEQLGEALAKDNFHVITGGYSGTMEAVSLGATHVKDAVIEGIISPSVFPHRGEGGNSHLTITTITPDLQERIGLFTKKANAFVVLPGNTGTLAELGLTWNLAIVAPFSKTKFPPIIAFRDPWGKFLEAIKPILGVSDQDIGYITLVDTVDDVIRELKKLK